MSGQDDHPHIPHQPFTPFQQQPASTTTNDSTPIAIDFDVDTTAAVIMPTLEEMQQLAAAQAEQLQKANDMLMQQQQQMVDAQATFDAQAQQLRDSAEQMRQQQQTINQLSSAFQTLTTATAASTTAPSSHRKKPEMPPFDQQNILVWIKRLLAAYDRAGVTQAKDKFAYLESTFDITFNPIINDFLFNSNNTDDDWNNFITYMKQEYGPTIRQKARKLIGDLPRNSMKPSQYLSQLEEEVKDVKLDDIKKEHLLKSIPPRIREILGKAVETKSAKEVAKMADDYFDSQGRPLEKSATLINHVANTAAATATATTPQPPFTAAFSDDEPDVSYVKKGNFKSFRQRSKSRPQFGNSNSAASASSSSTATTATTRQQQGGSSNNSNNSSLCRFHRMFGDSATRCISNCSRHAAFMSQQAKKQQQGNGLGGRRL